ncbi:hypothetical protein EVAR_37044_1 [Eumeta japonica]|uniref:Uncharacterized protein n=1 Tax=Eumeta variegata TaxID=151549 RepID=A0A4C1WHW0_EUMVA|nr:hypothetical protein EVAR_37044_1 [Eumeta japonica]
MKSFNGGVAPTFAARAARSPTTLTLRSSNEVHPERRARGRLARAITREGSIAVGGLTCNTILDVGFQLLNIRTRRINIDHVSVISCGRTQKYNDSVIGVRKAVPHRYRAVKETEKNNYGGQTGG